jgi:hypothetical protein
MGAAANYAAASGAEASVDAKSVDKDDSVA